MVRNLISLYACLASVGTFHAASVALAQPAIGPGASSGTDIDLSAFEAKSDAQEDALLKAFARFDVNSDGKITRHEARPDDSLAGRFHALDRNRDGNLSPEEFATR